MAFSKLNSENYYIFLGCFVFIGDDLGWFCKISHLSEFLSFTVSHVNKLQGRLWDFVYLKSRVRKTKLNIGIFT